MTGTQKEVRMTNEGEDGNGLQYGQIWKRELRDFKFVKQWKFKGTPVDFSVILKAQKFTLDHRVAKNNDLFYRPVLYKWGGSGKEEQNSVASLAISNDNKFHQHGFHSSMKFCP